MVQLRPRTGSLPEAISAYWYGDFTQCLESTFGNRDISATFLRARAFNRLGRPESALHEIRAIGALTSHLQKAERAVIEISSLTKLRHFDDASALHSEVRPYAFGAACAALEAEYELYGAVLRFSERDTQGAAEGAVRVFEVEASPFTRSDYFAPLEVTQALAFELLGLVAARRERYAEQAAHLRDGLRVLERASVHDAHVFASLLSNLAFIVRDLDLESDAQYIRGQLEKLSRSSDLEGQRFHILRALGWCSALRGDHLAAFRDFRQAAESTATVPLKILAALDRAYLARELHEGILASDGLETAEDLSRRVDWEAVPGEDRVALLALARELARVSPGRARQAYNRFVAIRSKLSPQLLSDLDRRARADQAFTHAEVLRHEGETSRAVLLFEESFQIYDQVGYRWNAATAALALGELTGHERFRAYVLAEAQMRPRSWLARRAHEMETSRPA